LSALLAEHVGKGGVALVVAHHDLNVAVQTRQLELQ
jgi:ABC-type transport system involved in cytochrome c biogenesis ATPase subunit